MMNTAYLLFLLILFSESSLQSQNQIQWYGGINRDFISKNPTITVPKIGPLLVKMSYKDGILKSSRDEHVNGFLLGNGSTGTDQNENILFYTNGLRIYNAQGDIMEGGDSLGIQLANENYKVFWAFADTAFGTPEFDPTQYIPYPGRQDEYLIFYNKQYNYTSIYTSFTLCYAHIDMKYNNGLGKVISKDNLLISSSLYDMFTLVRHGNGRDWWLISSFNNSNKFDFYFISSEGIRLSHSDKIGPSFLSERNKYLSNKISFDGNYLAKAFQCNNICIYKIDRCSGKLEFLNSYNVNDISCGIFDPYFIPVCLITDYTYTGHCISGYEFSADGRFLYVSKNTNLYQIDLNKNTNGLIYGSNELSIDDSYFMQRFPNGKIYIDTEKHKFYYLSELCRPELNGLSSDFNVAAIHTYDSIYYRLNQWPDYYLGKQKGSICDTL